MKAEKNETELAGAEAETAPTENPKAVPNLGERGAGLGARARKALEGLVGGIGRLAGKARKANAFLSPSYLVPPRDLVLVLAMALVSALVMAVEAVQFNMLLLVSNYVKASSVISIAMLGISIGGFLAFALAKFRPSLVMALASLVLLLSLALSYLSFADFAALGFPVYLILPYVAASLVVSLIFTQTPSTLAYFVNLVASGLGAVAPIWMVPAFKSEGSLFALMLVPLAILFLLSLRIKNILLKLAIAGLALLLGARVYGFVAGNLAYPETIAAGIFEDKIVAEMKASPAEPDKVNFAADFFARTYALDGETGLYRFGSDEYDERRARHFLSVLGFTGRFGIPLLDKLEGKAHLEDPLAIPQAVFENELAREIRRRYAQGFRRDYDLEFLASAYERSGDSYLLDPDKYARERAKLLLGELGHFPHFDLALDIRRNGEYDDRGKSFNSNARIVLDKDSTLGRVQFTRSGERFNMAINGVVLDNIDPYNGNYYDPRVPFLEDAKVFIVGLSADGIPKSVKRHKGAQVSGAELNPTIWESMTDGGFYQSYADDPYKNVEAYKAEARSWLENSAEKFDLITLMNIHQDHGIVATLGPENLHTVEATMMMLDRLSDRGMLDYEEIIVGRRSELAFLKLMNTLKVALRASGQAEPERCIHISKWDFWGGDVFRTLSVKKSPFTPAEVKALADYLEKAKETGNYSGIEVIYDPLSPGPNPIDAFIRGADTTGLRELPSVVGVREFASRVIARAKDPRDADFALRFYPSGGDGKHYLRSKALGDSDRRRLEGIMDAAGFSLDIDLSPVYDDSPFPFNVYAKKTEVTDILLALLPLALLLAAPLFVILLRSVGSYEMSLGPPLAFAAISGFAFMLVEVVLMQKFQLYVGDPTQSLIVILGGMLVFSGLGSLASGIMPRKLVVGLVALIPFVLGLYAWKLDAWFLALTYLRGNGRLIAATLTLLPLAFLMGIPFPNALETIKARTSPDFASLLFGVNGLACTLGSAMAFYINVSSGYQRSFLVGTVSYVAAAIFFVYFYLKAGSRSEPG